MSMGTCKELVGEGKFTHTNHCPAISYCHPDVIILSVSVLSLTCISAKIADYWGGVSLNFYRDFKNISAKLEASLNL